MKLEKRRRERKVQHIHNTFGGYGRKEKVIQGDRDLGIQMKEKYSTYVYLQGGLLGSVKRGPTLPKRAAAEIN